MVRSAVTPRVSNREAELRSGLSRFAAKSVAHAADFPGRRRREMRGAAERIGVAIALQELPPRHSRLCRIDVESRRDLGMLQLKRRVDQIAGKDRIVFAAAEGNR